MPDLLLCLQADDPVKVGQYGEDIKREGYVILDRKIIDEPHGLGNDQNCLECGLVPDIDHPGVETSGYDRQPADPAERVDFDRQQDLHADHKQLYRDGQGTFQAKQIPDDTDQGRNSSGQTTKDDIGDAHQSEHGTLREQNRFPCLEKTDGDHKHCAGKRYSISDNDYIHSDPPK